MDPFADSQALADWTATILRAGRIDEIARWRMVEYWFQVELFRAAQSGKAGAWQHIGDFEHPYHTNLPRSGSKTNTKWIDLLFAEPNPESPRRVVWCELKDIGRSQGTAENNAKGLGHDLAALWAIDPKKTKELWLNPMPHSMDRGRLDEWNRFGNGIDGATQMISQIVLCHKSLCAALPLERIQELWQEAFASKSRLSEVIKSFPIAVSETDEFAVLTLVAKPAYDG
ncbi:hypothetical protein [Halovibrio salipaludis]|nr:hypothetical protein [Halovibrio salipaludis]